jgi:hypothetical protein
MRLAVFLLLSLPAFARADEVMVPQIKNVDVPASAAGLELTAGATATQGFGPMRGGTAQFVGDIAGAGIGGQVGMGYRFGPRLSLDGGFEAITFTGVQQSVYGTTAMGGVTVHVDPWRRFDPWLQIGAGWRRIAHRDFVWNAVEVGRFTLGFDMRADRHVAFGTVFGAGLDVFPADPEPRLTTFLFAGVQGRFDLAR